MGNSYKDFNFSAEKFHVQNLNLFEKSLEEVANNEGDAKISGFIKDNLDWVFNKKLSKISKNKIIRLVENLPEEEKISLQKILKRCLEGDEKNQIVEKEINLFNLLDSGVFRSDLKASIIENEKKPMSEFFENKDEAIDFAIANKLKFIDLSGFKDVDNDDIAKLSKNCPEIEVLSINSVKISDLALEEIAVHLQNLKNLNISQCSNITDAGLKHVSKLKNLTTLDISACTRITDVGLEHVSKLKNLTNLDLRMCKGITDAGLKPIGKLKNLRILQLKGRQITDAGLKHVSKLENLTTLNLGACVKITDKGLKYVTKLENLTTLNLRLCNELTDKGLSYVSKLKNLNSLDLFRCEKITDAAKLKRLLKVQKKDPVDAKRFLALINLPIPPDFLDHPHLVTKLGGLLSKMSSDDVSNLFKMVKEYEISEIASFEHFIDYNTSSKNLITRLKNWYLSKDQIVTFFKDPVEFMKCEKGKELIELNRDVFHVEPLFRQLLLNAYPLDDPQNLNLYLTVSRRNNNTHITVEPDLIAAQPDAIFNKFKDYLGVTPRIRVTHFGSPGIDTGALGRQFVFQMTFALTQSSKEFSFKALDDGLAPTSKGTFSDSNEEQWRKFGEFIGSCLKMNYRTGEFFSPLLFYTLKTFSEKDLAKESLNPDEFYAGKSQEEFLEDVRYLGSGDEELKMCSDLTFQAFSSSNKKEAEEAADSLCDLLALEPSSPTLDEYRKVIREHWLEVMDGNCSLEATHALARGMNKRLPFTLIFKEDDVDVEKVINSWSDLKGLKAEQISKGIQGELNPELLKANLTVHGDNDEKAEEVKGWIDEWIDKNAKNKGFLSNLAITLTGGPSGAVRMGCRIVESDVLFYPHSCMNYAEISSAVTKELLMEELNAVGRGERKDFNVA